MQVDVNTVISSINILMVFFPPDYFGPDDDSGGITLLSKTGITIIATNDLLYSITFVTSGDYVGKRSLGGSVWGWRLLVAKFTE